MLHNQTIKKLGKIYDRDEISDLEAMKRYISFHNETRMIVIMNWKTDKVEDH